MAKPVEVTVKCNSWYFKDMLDTILSQYDKVCHENETLRKELEEKSESLTRESCDSDFHKINKEAYHEVLLDLRKSLGLDESKSIYNLPAYVKILMLEKEQIKKTLCEQIEYMHNKIKFLEKFTDPTTDEWVLISRLRIILDVPNSADLNEIAVYARRMKMNMIEYRNKIERICDIIEE